MAKNKRGSAVLAGLGFGVAAGVAFGTLVLAPNLPEGAHAELTRTKEELSRTKEDATINAAQAESADKVIGDLSPKVVEGTLAKHSVLVIRTADAADEDVQAITKLLGAARAEKAGELKLEEKFLSKDGADALKSIVANTLPAGTQLSTDNLDPGTHAGQALAGALTMDEKTGDPKAGVADRKLLLSALSDAGFVSYTGETLSPAESIIIVTGDSDGLAQTQAGETDTPTSSFGAQTLAKFATALDKADGHVVLAGRVHTTAPTGVIGLLRKDGASGKGPTTVDSIKRDWARLASVLAIGEKLDGGAGAYGAASSADAVAPAPRPAEQSSSDHEGQH